MTHTLVILLGFLALCASVTYAHPHAHKTAAHHNSPHHLHHSIPSHDLEESLDAFEVTYTDKNNLPGIVSVVTWVGYPSKPYDIFVGDAEDPAKAWITVESHIVLDNHPVANEKDEKKKKISKSLSTSHNKVLEVSLDAATPAKHVIVCEADEEEKSVCGHTVIVDSFDRQVWWTTNDLPRATFIPFVRADGTLYTGGTFPTECTANELFRGVLHTTETTGFQPSTTSFYGHTSAPHFTVYYDKKTKTARTYQHLPIDVAARALKNLPGGVETNKQCAIQIEIATKAATSNEMPAEQKSELKELIAWISSEKKIRLETVEYFGANDVHRFSNEMWTGYNGWCGHQHVPENDHWDPGMIGKGPAVADSNVVDWSTSTLYTELGLKQTQCFKDNQWSPCNQLPSLEQDDE